MKSILSILMVCVTLAVTAQQRRRPPEYKPFENLEKAQAYITAQETKGLFSGTALVASKGSIKHLSAHGLADKNTGRKIETDTRINIGSINKVFTGVSILLLAGQGKLKLDDKIKKYIPELSMDMADEITIRQILQMKSGLGSYFEHPEFQKNRSGLTRMEDYLPFIKNEKLSFQPGEGRRYSNSGFELLGILIERLSGVSYYDFVQKNIYDKVGMENSGSFNRHEISNDQAKGYRRSQEGVDVFDQDVSQMHAVIGTPAGGGYSTVEDLYRFITALYQNKVLSEESTDIFFNRYESQPSRRTFYRVGGGSMGINAQIIADFEKDYVCVVLSNYDPPTASDLAGRLAKTAELKTL